jgi:molybdopterin biosynthesis enzyme
VFRKLKTFDEAKKAIEEQFKPVFLGEEEAVLLEAYNRVLNEDIVSSLDIPPFNRSTVDGYAVKAEDTVEAEENEPATLRVSGVVNIGEQPQVKVAKGETVEIVTGAPIPEGADAVVMVEDTERHTQRECHEERFRHQKWRSYPQEGASLRFVGNRRFSGFGLDQS